MARKLVTPILFSVLSVFLFSGVSTQARSVRLLQTPSTSTVDAAKKKAVAPEPATWMYVLGAVLLVVVIERKALKALFSSSSTN